MRRVATPTGGNATRKFGQRDSARVTSLHHNRTELHQIALPPIRESTLPTVDSEAQTNKWIRAWVDSNIITGYG